MLNFPSAIPKLVQKDIVHLRLRIGNKLPVGCSKFFSFRFLLEWFLYPVFVVSRGIPDFDGFKVTGKVL